MAYINGNPILFAAQYHEGDVVGSGVVSGENYVSRMSVIDENRIKDYEEDGGYYFSENNWNKFIGENNRVYVERSNDRGTYGMYALSYNANAIYNAWYSKEDWAERFATEHPGEEFREPYDDEYPLLDSVVQRHRNGQIVVPLVPTEGRHAVAKEYLDGAVNDITARITALDALYAEKLAQLESLNSSLENLNSSFNNLQNQVNIHRVEYEVLIRDSVLGGTHGLALRLANSKDIYIVDGRGRAINEDRIDIPGYYEGLPVTQINSNAFSSSPPKSISIPATINYIGQNAFGWSGAVEEVYIKDLKRWCDITFGSSASPITANHPKVYINGVYSQDLIIPDGVGFISSRAFMHCTQFRRIDLPLGLIAINDMAFQYCSGLETLTIPQSVKFIGSQAFGRCTTLRKVTFTGCPTDLSESAFDGDTNLTDIYVPWSQGVVSGAITKWGAINATIHYNSEV